MTTSSSNSTHISSSLDLNSVLKVSQTLSSEVALESLLVKMMKIFIEYAEAEKGYLILNKDEQWVIEASGTITSDEVQVLQSIPIETISDRSDTLMLPNAIANYVIRTQKSLVLQDAVHEGEFTRDPYIIKQKPKSILCTPLIHQGKLVGILYLENNLKTGAFTPDRLELLNLLSSQAAISIENAKLYGQLRESESKWTQILEAVPVGISVHDVKGKVCYINQTGQRLLGQGIQAEAAPEQLAQTYQVYIAETDQLYPTEQLPALRALKGEQVIVEDFEIHRDGTIIPFEVRATPVFDENGNIIYAVNVFQDITERKQAEKLLANYNRTLEAEVTRRTAELTQANQQLEREIADRQQVEAALRESEERFRGIFNQTFQFVGLLSPDGILLEANQTALDFGGITRSQVVGKPFWEARWWTISPDTQEQLKAAIARASQGEFVRYEVDVLGRGTQVVTIDFSLRPLQDESGQVKLLIPEGRDISDRKRAEAAIQQSEARYRAIVEDQTELVSRFLPDGTLTFINAAYCRYFGVKQEELIGKHYAPVVFEDDLERVEQLLKSISRDNPVVIVENRVVVAGEVRWMQWINRALFDQQGNLLELQSVGRDIRDRKQVEQALEDSERRYRQIVETADEGIWMLDPQGNTTFANPKMAQMLGYSVEEMLGMPVFVFMDEQQRAIIKQNLERRRHGIAGKHDFKFRRKDGFELWIMVASSPIFDELGQFQGVLGMMTDITQRKAAEIALRQQKELFQTIFDHIPVMLCFYDANAQVQLANRAFEQTLGWSLAELRQIDIMAECYPDPDYRASVLEFMMKADGTWRDIQLRTRAGIILETCWANVRLPDGSQVGIGQDISDRKRAELALQESEERWQLALRGTNDGIWDWNLRTNTVFFSPRWKQMRGFAEHEIGNSLEQWSTQIHPDDRDRVMQALADHFARKTPLFRIEYRVLRKDNSYIWVLDRGQAIWDEAGHVVRMAGSESDITQRKQAEEARRESENRFRAVFEQAAVGMGLCTLEGQFFRVNQKLCDLVGYTRAEMLERTFQDITPVKYRPQMRESVCHLLAGEIENYSLENRYICKDGSLVWVNVAVSLMHEPTGEPKYFIYIAEDISDRKQTEEALQQAKQAAEAANQAKSTFLANMSHELRTPLNAILGFSQLLAGSSFLSPEHRKNLDTIMRSGEHLLTLINQILDLSKIEAGRTTLNETSFDLYHLLGDLKDLFQLKAHNKGLQLQVEWSPDVPRYIHTDEVKLRQILINLLSNAMKFTSSGGVSVRLSVVSNTKQRTTDNGQLTIHFEVEDTGSGIAADELESIFDAFVQTKTGQQFQEGTGLGLTITRKFVQLMGVKSPSVPKSTRVLLFPLTLKPVGLKPVTSKLNHPSVKSLPSNPTNLVIEFWLWTMLLTIANC